jgi:hypothetical protein
MQHGGDSGRDRTPSPTPPPGSPPPNPQPPHDSPYAHCLPVSDWAGQGWASSAHTANDTFDLRADARQLRLSADALSGVARFRARAGPADASVQLYARVRHRDKSVLDRIEACLRPNGTGIDFRVRHSVRSVRAHSSQPACTRRTRKTARAGISHKSSSMLFSPCPQTTPRCRARSARSGRTSRCYSRASACSTRSVSTTFSLNPLLDQCASRYAGAPPSALQYR